MPKQPLNKTNIITRNKLSVSHDQKHNLIGNSAITQIIKTTIKIRLALEISRSWQVGQENLLSTLLGEMSVLQQGQVSLLIFFVTVGQISDAFRRCSFQARFWVNIQLV